MISLSKPSSGSETVSPSENLMSDGYSKNGPGREKSTTTREIHPRGQARENSYSMEGYTPRQFQESGSVRHEERESYFTDNKWKLNVQDNGKSYSTAYPRARARADKKKTFRRETTAECCSREYSRRDHLVPSPTITSSTAEDELDLTQLRNSRHKNRGTTMENSNTVGQRGYVSIGEAPSMQVDLAARWDARNEPDFARVQKDKCEKTASSSGTTYTAPLRLRIVETQTGRGIIAVSNEQIAGFSDVGTTKNSYQDPHNSPISGSSAMSISSGPSRSHSPRRDESFPKESICIECKRPEVPRINFLIRCGHCNTHIHTSCHNPVILVGRGTIDYNSSTWMCQQCSSRSRDLSAATPSEVSRRTSAAQSPLSKLSLVKTEDDAELSKEAIINERQILPSEARSYQKEEDGNSSDVSMSLGSSDGHVPIKIEVRQVDIETGQTMEAGLESPLYAPSVGDPHKTDSDGYQPKSHTSHSESSSPPYSPPPAEVPAHAPATNSQRGLQPPGSLNNSPPTLEFFCRSCHNLVAAGTGSYKGSLCSSCGVHTIIRPDQSSRQDSKLATAPPHQQITSFQHAQSSKVAHGNQFLNLSNPGSDRSPVNRANTFQEISAQSIENFQEIEAPEMHSTHAGEPLARKRTTKDIVAERYNMTFSEPEHNSTPQSKAFSIALRRKRKREESSLPFAVPVKRNYNQALSNQTKAPTNAKLLRKDNHSSVDNKQKDAPTSLGNPLNGESAIVAENGLQSKRLISGKSIAARKSVRAGPAVKSGGRTRRQAVASPPSDAEGEERHDVIIERLQKKLQEQKVYTKRQMEKCAKMESKFKECEREKGQLLSTIESLQNQIDTLKPKEKLRRKPMNKEPEQHPPARAAERSNDEDSEPVTSLRELFKRYTITANSPWVETTTASGAGPEIEMKDRREKSWHKSEYYPYDYQKLMNIHLHRQKLPTRGPVVGIVMQRKSDGEGVDGNRDEAVGEQMTFDEFLGLPVNMIPATKDGALGFRSGVINQRTRRLERNVPHYKIRTPGDIRSNI